MDITTAFNAPIIKIANGTEYTFPRLSPPDLAQFVASLKAHMVADVKRLCDECEIKGAEKLKALKEAEARDPIINWVWWHACTPAGAVETVTLSLKKAGKNDIQIKATLEAFDYDTLSEVALLVSGAPKDDPKPIAEEKKADEVDPKKAQPQMTEPVGYGK